MKTIFDTSTYDELLDRIDKLAADTPPQWGKMSAAQMMEHIVHVLEMASGKRPMTQSLIGKAIGWAFKGQFVGEKPVPKSSPTVPAFEIKHEPEFAAAKAELKGMLAEFYSLGEKGTDGNIHVFFGAFSGKQWGETQYKHVDHHLRQFGL